MSSEQARPHSSEPRQGSACTSQLDPPQLLTTSQAAEWLSVTPAALTKWRVAKYGPAYIKIGGAIRYEVADLAAFVVAGRVQQ